MPAPEMSSVDAVKNAGNLEMKQKRVCPANILNNREYKTYRLMEGRAVEKLKALGLPPKEIR